MLITLNIATLAHRSGDTIDVDDVLAADLVAGGHATFADPPEADAGTENARLRASRRVGNYDFHGNAYVGTATIASLEIKFPVDMRAIPTLTMAAPSGIVVNDGSVAPVASSFALSGAVNHTTKRVLVNITCAAGGLTLGRGYIVYSNNSLAGIIDLSAEI